MKINSLIKFFPQFALLFAVASAHSQSISVYRTNSEMSERLAPQPAISFASSAATATTSQITIDDTQKFQIVDGFGASLTDSAAWLFSKLKPEQLDAAYATLFSRKDGIALSFLRQPIGSSDLAVTFYSFDDLCKQDKKPCITPDKVNDFKLKHFSVAHDEAYIIPQLKKALAINPDLKIMISALEPSRLDEDHRLHDGLCASAPKSPPASATTPTRSMRQYFVKTIIAYESAGIPIYALSVQNEPLYAPENYCRHEDASPRAGRLLRDCPRPALAAIDQGPGKGPKILGYDHNWDRPDYPEMLLDDPKAASRHGRNRLASLRRQTPQT